MNFKNQFSKNSTAIRFIFFNFSKPCLFFVSAELCTTSLNDFSFYMIYDFIFRLVASY